MNRLGVFLVLISFSLSIYLANACTVFYIAKDNQVIAGNNEDSESKATQMVIYPPSGDKNGWIKFGFSDGQPQGGMNQHGLFWDASVSPHREMPVCVNNKQLYNGCLMQRVMEDCKNVDEAMEVFESCYCNEMFTMQFMIGDESGKSVIISGDQIIQNENGYQVLTNFYESDPDLGNFPCWRYEEASKLLWESAKADRYLARSVLEATHLKMYTPTLYSNIYDLKNKKVYLYNNHSFEEMAVINLNIFLKSEENSFDIPSIFSQITVLSPDHGATTKSTSAELRWEGDYNSTYYIQYSTHPSLLDHKSEIIIAHEVPEDGKDNNKMAYLLIPLVVCFSLFKKTKKVLVIVLIGISFAYLNCELIEEDTTNYGFPETFLFGKKIESLQPGTTYYWKLVATNDPAARLSTETPVYSFTTGE
jgi:choloylglycine hydrolase